MDYNLALELKKAGFPQEGKGEWVFEDTNGQPTPDRTDIVTYFPTLSELIESCGESLTILENWGDGWTAYEEKHDEMSAFGKEGKGSTPSEAVAKLWLELNKK